MRLSGSCEYGAPGRALRIESFLLGRQQLDRDMNEVIVQKSDYQAGSAGHGGMGSIARKPIAKNCVFSIVWTAANDITRVEIPHHQRNSPPGKPFFDLVAQKQTDIAQPDVAGSV